MDQIDKEGDIPITCVQLPSGYRPRRKEAEDGILTTASRPWVALESIHLGRLDNPHKVNEYYHKISEAPFKKRFADYSNISMSSGGQMLTGNKGNMDGFYAGQQTAYFVDDNMKNSTVINEYNRPSLYHLMKQYKQKQKTATGTAGKGGHSLPPIRHTNNSRDEKTALNSGGRERLSLGHRKQPRDPEDSEMMENDVRIPEVGEFNVCNTEEQPQCNLADLSQCSRTQPGQTDNSYANETILKMSNEDCVTDELGLVVKSGDLSIKVGQKQHSTYEKRKMYGRNLERNWFTEQMQKKNISVSLDVSSDMFYSPGITESEGGSDVENVEDGLCADRKLHPMAANSDLFSSTDVLMGEEGELEDTTASEYEIIIKDNVLMEKKTKHKMRKKRQRKRDKYLKFEQNYKSTNPDISRLTDTQLRAMRLKIAKKNTTPRLKGKRKFLQIANAVFVVVQFTKLLQKVRKARRKKRITFKKSRKLTLKPGSDDMYDEFERKPTPISLKHEFLKTVGDSLIRDVMKLDIKDNETRDEMMEANTAPLRPDTPLDQLLAKVSEGVQLHRLAHRRGSDPGLARPTLFAIEVFQTSKVRRRDMSKSTLVSKSSQNRSALCDQNRKSICPRGRLKAKSRKKTSKCAIHGVNTGSGVKENTILFDRQEVLRKRRPSLDMEEIKSGQPIELHDLLAGIDIPAKEIKIQIALRKMRRRKIRQTTRPDTIIKTAMTQRPRFDFDEVIVPPKVVVQKILPQKPPNIKRKQEKPNQEEINQLLYSYSNDGSNRYDYNVPAQPITLYGAPAQPITAYGAPAPPITAYGAPAHTITAYGAPAHTITAYGAHDVNTKYGYYSPAKPIMSYGGLSWDPVTTPARPRYSDEDIAKEMERVSTLMLELRNCRYIRWTPLQQAVIARNEKINYQNTVC